MKELEHIEKLIKYGYENDALDFKATQYKRKENLLLDLIAFANSSSNKKKYIIVGVKDNPNGERDIIGVDEGEFKDSAEYQQLIYANIEPDLDIDYIPYQYEGKLLGVFILKGCLNKPYMMKKKFNNLNQGLCYIRKGSQQVIATRADYDRFYYEREGISIELKDTSLFASGRKGDARCSVLFRNNSRDPITIMGGCIELFDESNNKLSHHTMYGFDKEFVGADFNLHLPPKTEKYGDGWFGFNSSDCLRIGMTADGITTNRLRAKFTVWDSRDDEYSFIIDDFVVFAKGDVLWKVELKEKNA